MNLFSIAHILKKYYVFLLHEIRMFGVERKRERRNECVISPLLILVRPILTKECFRASWQDLNESLCGSYPMLESTSLWFEMEE